MKLEALNLDHQGRFLGMIEDFERAGQSTGLNVFGNRGWTPDKFRKFVKNCEKSRMDWRPGPGKVSLSHYVLCDGGEICGYGLLRFPLDETTERQGGNLEFYVPPSKRQQGYGALTLNRLLFEAVRAGLARALVTCRADNIAARKCIEKNRGERIEDAPDGETLRFWIRFR